jgi:hypothetical protein
MAKIAGRLLEEKSLPQLLSKKLFRLFILIGILGTLKFLVFQIIGLFKPIYRQAEEVI